LLLGNPNKFRLQTQDHLSQEEDQMKTLRDVRVGESARVVKVHGQGRIRRRVMDMGITKNVEVFVRKVAPLGDPIEVNLRGYELSLRKIDAEIIEVE
jgi:ferrous iron transport protein A